MSAVSGLNAALLLADAGVPCFPCGPDKAPLVEHGFKSATTDQDEIRLWWRDHPSAMVGVPTGKASGVWVADLDIDRTTGETVGLNAIRALGIEPPPYTVRTRSGGAHWLYRWREDLPHNTAKRLPGVDSRGEGGYIVVWDPRPLIAAVGDPDLPPPPEVLLAALRKPEPPPRNSVPFTTPSSDGYAEAALAGETAAVRSAGEGTRNHQLNTSAFSLGQIVGSGLLSAGRVEAELLAAAAACGLHPIEASKTIASGMTAGIENPRGPAGPRTPERKVMKDEQVSKVVPSASPGGVTIEVPVARMTSPYQGDTAAVDYSGPVDEVAKRLNAAGAAFQFGGFAAVVLRQESAIYRDPADPSRMAEVLRVARAVRDNLRRPVEQVSIWTRFDARVKARVKRPVPSWCLQQIIAEGGAGLAPLSGVADHPVFYGAKLLAGHIGYHRETKLFIDCAPVPAYQWESPEDALFFLTDTWLKPFPFYSSDDQLRALLVPLTLLTRRTIIRGGAPLVLITSPEMNTGKSILTRCLYAAVAGSEPPLLTFPKQPEEFSKTFAAALFEGRTLLFFDNAPNGWSIASNDLDAYAQSDEFGARVLGVTETKTVPALALVLITGNNIEAAGDTRSRTMEVRLERPAEQDPQLQNALAFTIANRRKILSAFTAILRAAPMDGISTRFPQWERIAARPLMALAGANQILEPLALAASLPESNEALECLLERMAEMQKGLLVEEQRLRPGDLLSDAVCRAALADLTGTEADQLKAAHLPARLKPFHDKLGGAYRLRHKVAKNPDTRKDVTWFSAEKVRW